MKINKYKVLFLIFLILTILCPIFYNIIGSKVLEDGTLDEPFYLIIFMYVSLLLTTIFGIIYFIKRKKK